MSKVKCPNCNKEVEGQVIFDNSKIEGVFGDTIIMTAHCPKCNELIWFESAPAFYHNGRRFYEFKRTTDNKED